MAGFHYAVRGLYQGMDMLVSLLLLALVLWDLVMGAQVPHRPTGVLKLNNRANGPYSSSPSSLLSSLLQSCRRSRLVCQSFYLLLYTLACQINITHPTYMKHVLYARAL